MKNGPVRAEFWKNFMLERSDYPAPDRLRRQLQEAVFSEFCDCGCNSFAVNARDECSPLVRPGGGYGAIYAEEFYLSNGQTLEFILFANELGNLAFIEIDCCSNSYPVPEKIAADSKPFHSFAYTDLIY